MKEMALVVYDARCRVGDWLSMALFFCFWLRAGRYNSSRNE